VTSSSDVSDVARVGPAVTILAIDPGTVQSAWVVYDPSWCRVVDFGIEPNSELIDRLRSWHDFARLGEHPFLDFAVVEKIESYGMPVGAEVFATVHWSGRFEEALYPTPVVLLPRRAVKLHLCGDSRAKDPNIRQALLDRFGGKLATGTKKAPGPLYGIHADLWAALAVAVTYADLHGGAK
jgi:hypothetical protein